MDHLKKCPFCYGTGKVLTDRATGGAMRKARKKAGLPIRTVAGRIGVSIGYISHLELGRRQWTRQLRDNYVDALE